MAGRARGVTPAEICGWLEMVIKPLVTKPETIAVSEAGRSGGTFLLALHIDPVDRGAAIGRDGETIRAIRVLAAAAGRRHGLRVAFDLAEAVHRG
jgi:predicted RNA-binding protein YlqC (UPF0109 family)